MRRHDRLMSEVCSRLAVVEQPEHGRRCVDDDHRPVRPASTSATMSFASTERSGRSASSAGLSARRAITASSRVANAETDNPSRAASRSSLAPTSSGTFRRYSVLMSHNASSNAAICDSHPSLAPILLRRMSVAEPRPWPSAGPHLSGNRSARARHRREAASSHRVPRLRRQQAPRSRDSRLGDQGDDRAARPRRAREPTIRAVQWRVEGFGHGDVHGGAPVPLHRASGPERHPGLRPRRRPEASHSGSRNSISTPNARYVSRARRSRVASTRPCSAAAAPTRAS